ncbi:MAG TPA: HD domain-containing phosphohydrolase, partial [Candidatus Eisenbacteria bacterium]|nr:HD domain-containing phosphohydrolase [Candidatus Eisenbacteria bacterium]
MPVMDGLETCRRLKQDERTALIPVTMITGWSDPTGRIQGIEAGADDFLTKPFDEPTLSARIRSQLRLKRITDQLESTESVIFTMARWVEIKDQYTEGHLRRVAGYAERIAAALEFERTDLVNVRYAGILHDIGKIAVPETIIAKEGPLTSEEREVLEKHPDHGAEIIAPMRFAPAVAPIIRAHHERWDGMGYPHHLRGEDIPVGARIIAVVDAWDAMTTDRSYRRALDTAEAERRLREGAGSQWDPEIVEVFLQLRARGNLIPMGTLTREPIAG